MKSITIHKIDHTLMALIQDRATETGLSLNKTVKLLLREALGLDPASATNKRQSFEAFCGLWDKDELASFEKNVADLNKIDPEDWK